MLNKTYNPQINTSTDFMKSSLHSLSVKIILILLFLLSPFFTQAQELTDQQIGFDPTRITQSLKERGITDPAILDQEVAIMRESQKHMYQEKQKIQKEILAKIEKEQKKSSSTNRLTTTIPQEEREALIAFYKSMGGSSWRNTGRNDKPWKIDDPTSDVSNWYGVIVSEGHVKSLDLRVNNLSGTIPSKINDLSSLVSLQLYGNNLSGTITPLYNLKNLTLLDLSVNQFSGDISFISDLTNLTNLALNSNKFTGGLDPLLNLKSLTNLHLGVNKFTGNINVLTNLTNLTNLSLNQNQFTGTIDSISYLNNLTYLNLDYTQLSGNINAVSNLLKLTDLKLGNNQFSGDISNISNLTNLTYLNLVNNKLLTGNLNSLTSLIKLNYLDLGANELLQGNLQELSNLKSLNYLNLGNNRFLEGNLTALSNLTNLTYLNLTNNKFTGKIIALSNLKFLTTLNIGNNPLEGDLEGISNLNQLVHLHLFSNNLVGNIDLLSNLVNLQILNLFGNGFTGDINSLANLKKLTSLTLDKNHFTGNIDVLSNLFNLTEISLSNNEFTGNINGLINSKKLYQLHLNKNNFVGEIDVLADITSLKICNLYENKFRFKDFSNKFQTIKTRLGSYFKYSPQSKINVLETISKTSNESVELKMFPEGDTHYLPDDTYQWFKNNIEIPGATSREYTIPSVALTDAGTYTCKSYHKSNPDMSPLVLEREPITLIVKETSCTTSSKTTPIVKELFKNLITKLLSLPEGTVTNGYTCPELSELAPYLTNPSPAIEDFVIYKDSWFSEQRVWIGITLTKNEKFLPEYEDLPTFNNFAKSYDIAIDTGGIQPDALGQMTDVDVSSYTSPAIGLQNIPSTFENGFAKMYVNHVNFCPETIEQTYCINQALSLNFETQDANLNYSWSIVDSANAIIATGTTPTVVFTPTAEGTYKIKLTASSIDKCETTFTKLILVKNCTPLESCTKNNPNATHIAGLFKNLVNKLITLPTTSVPNGFTCPELVELIPYIADTDAKIYNFTNIGNKISFSFDNHDLGDHDVVISYPTGVEISGFNLDAFVNDQTLTKITTNYSNGLSESTLSKVRHINFCANKIISCTESNPRTVKVKELFVKLLNHLKNRIEEGKEIPNGYTCEELRRFKYYTTEPQNVYIYNFNAATFSFSFHNGTNNFDVSIPELMQHPKETIQSVDLNYYTSANEYTSMDWKITLSSGVKLANGKVKHVEFCPNEICVQHVAVVVDESGSLDESEKRKIRNQLLSFVKEQARINNDIGANMHISLIGMSDSDKPSSRRTDHILEIKPDLINTNVGGILYNWITNYGNRYTIPNDGISEGSDFWLSGLEVSLNSSFKVKPSMVIMITDGAQTDNAGALKDFMKNFDNFADLKDITKPHLYVIGIKNGHYVYDPTTARTSNTLTKEEDPNFYPELDNISTANARVTSALSLSLKYLLGLEEVNKPLNLDINNFRTDYAGLDDFNLFRDDLTYISDKIAKAEINCGEESIKETCDDCFSFQPKPGQFYVLNAWVKEDVTEQQKTYSNPKIKLTFYDGNNTKIGEEIFHTVGNIIDGWQRIGNKFEIPNNDFDPLQQTVFIDFELINESKNVAVFFDDIRIYPVKGSMKTFVYDPENFRLMSELDENNYSTFYEYDNEGGLVRIKKETAQGVKTIQETRSGNVIKNN